MFQIFWSVMGWKEKVRCNSNEVEGEFDRQGTKTQVSWNSNKLQLENSILHEVYANKFMSHHNHTLLNQLRSPKQQTILSTTLIGYGLDHALSHSNLDHSPCHPKSPPLPNHSRFAHSRFYPSLMVSPKTPHTTGMEHACISCEAQACPYR